MNFLSLFAGIGGIDLGLERAGWTCVGQVECEPFCQAVLARHWPHVRRWTYIQHLLKELRNGVLFPVDAVAGGFPCQDLSVAGKGAGLVKGKRSRFWFAMLETIRHLKPRTVLVENVPALRTRGADTVLAGLEAAGYTCEAVVVGAEHVGAPHRRHRVWIVGSRTDSLCDAYGQHREGRGTAGQQGEAGLAVGRAPAELAYADQRIRSLGWSSDGLLRRGGGEGDCGSGYRWPARPGEPQHEWEHPRLIDFNSRVANAIGVTGLGGVQVAERGSEGGIAVGGAGVDGLGDARGERRESGPLSADGNGTVPAFVGASKRAADSARTSSGPSGQTFTDGNSQRRVGAATDGLSRRLVRLARFHNRNTLKAAGNSVIPEVVEVIGRAILAAERGSHV